MTEDFQFPPGRPLKEVDADDFALIEDSLRYWRVQDVELTLSTYADDVVYRLYTFQNQEPGFADLRGKDAVRTALYDILSQFDYLSYTSDILDVSDGVGRVQSRFVLRHRMSGESLSGSKRQRIAIAAGEIVRIDEYHDLALVNAFMRLTQIG